MGKRQKGLYKNLPTMMLCGKLVVTRINKEGLCMGMTDSQFKAHIRSLIRTLKEALEINPDNIKLQILIAELQQALED